MTMKFDHLVLLVHDLDATVRDFEALGFTVLERADTSHGSTLFRFISFGDGSYILLTAFVDEAAIAKHRLGPVLAGGEGWADYSFVAADVRAVSDRLKAAALPVAGPVQVSNVLANGEKWALDLLMTGRGADGDNALPFLVEDREGRGHRIPGPSVHANGATGILGLRITTTRLDAVSGTLMTMLGSSAVRTATSFHDRPALRIDFGAGWIEIVDVDESAFGRAGGGILDVLVETDAADVPAEGKELDRKLAHGAPITLCRA